MRTTNATPTLSQVRSEWQPWKLSEAGTEIRTRNGEFVTLIDETVTQIRAAGAHWSGDAYYAAYDRIAGDRDAANKVALDTEELAQTLIDSGTSLAGFRQALLDKVDQAVAAGFTVSEDWQVTPGPGGSDEDGEAQYTHQTAITTALNEMIGTQSDIATKIEQAGGDVRARSEQLGDGDPLDSGQTPEGDPILAVYSQPSDTDDQPADQSEQNDQGSPATTPAGTPQASPIADQQPASQEGADQSGKQDGADQSGKQDGADQSGKQDGADQSGKQKDDKTDDSGDGADKNKTDQPAQSPASTGAASDPNSWKPSDVTSLITAVGGITGNVPTLIESVSKLDDDLDDIIKAGGEASKGLIDSAGSAAEKFANAADTVITSVDRAADGTSTDAPATGDPAESKTPKSDPAGTDPTTGQPAATDPNAKATDPKADNSAAGNPANTDNSKTDKPNSPQSAESRADQPASVRQASYTGTDSADPSSSPAPASSSPSTAPASTGLLGAPGASRQSDSEHTRRVEATPTPLFETPPVNE
ncbi:hypothetical protein IU479_01500 [Nocardia abscessus]|uniref:hypothetical protein n=1 Tax=Nocardia abscessus TaxID=120957 RepID=UPI00189483C2|nr:hypothetical protein [Nocardia abscessus]MBF6216787.1 hypothetical protein [Nocardia abscessus]